MLWVGAGPFAGMLFKTQIALLLIHLIVSAPRLWAHWFCWQPTSAKWWERRRFYKMLRRPNQRGRLMT
jgi:hypothetical protein